MEEQKVRSTKEIDDYHRSVEAITLANQVEYLVNDHQERYFPNHDALLFKNVQGTIEVCIQKAQQAPSTLIEARYLLAASRLAYVVCTGDRWEYITDVCNRIHPRVEKYLENYDPFSKDIDLEVESVIMNIMSDYFHMIHHETMPTAAPRLKEQHIMKAYTCGMRWLEEFEWDQWESQPLRVQLRRLRDLVNYGASRQLLNRHDIARQILPVIEQRMERSEEYSAENFSLYINILLRLNDKKDKTE